MEYVSDTSMRQKYEYQIKRESRQNTCYDEPNIVFTPKL